MVIAVIDPNIVTIPRDVWRVIPEQVSGDARRRRRLEGTIVKRR
jgi:hypothetical protein